MISLNLKDFYGDREITKKVKVIITPQSPLSIAGVLNSKYIKTKRTISNNMIYGMLENMLGFHLKTPIREEIVKMYKLTKNKTNNHKQGFEYIPIISDICKITNVFVPIEKHIFVDDFSCHVKFNDSRSFPTSTHDMSLKYLSSPKLGEKMEDYGKYSNYYKTMGKREYLVFYEGDKIIIDLEVTEKLYQMLFESNKINQVLYLGNSESIVNVELN